MSDLSSFLNTGVPSAYFKPFGYHVLYNALLKLVCTKFEIKSLFSLIILTDMSSVWKTFLKLNLLTSLTVSSNETNLKAKLGHPILSMFLLIERMLGWFLNLLVVVPGSVGIFRPHKLRITLLKSLLNISAIWRSSTMVFPSSVKLIISIWETLSEKSGLTVFQNVYY